MSELISFFKEMIEASKERVKTPITGAFLLSFLIYNWKPISVFIYSKQSIENTVEHISREYCTYYAIIIPVFIAVTYTVVLPYGMMWIEKFHAKAKKKRKEIFNDVRKHELNEKAEILRLERNNEDVRSGNVEKAQLNYRIKTLEEQNSAYEDRINIEIKDKTDLTNEINRLKKELLEIKNIDQNITIADDKTNLTYGFSINSDEVTKLRKLKNKLSETTIQKLKVLTLTTSTVYFNEFFGKLELDTFFEIGLIESVLDNSFRFTPKGLYFLREHIRRG